MSDDPKFPLTAAQLVANWSETLFYGIYLATSAFAVRTLFLTGSERHERWRNLDEIRWMMVFFAVTFLGVLTFDIAIGIEHNYIAFIQSQGPDGPLDEFLDLDEWINVTRSVTQAVAMALGDFILIYRCWIVYGRRWLIITPSVILFFGSIATSIRLVQLEVEPATTKEATLDSSADVSAWIITMFALATGQNVLSTGLLIFRIWRVDHDFEKYLGHSVAVERRQPKYLRKVIVTIAESGAFYTMTVLLSVILAVIKSDGFYPMADISLQATGIVFNVILVRASTLRDRQFTTYNAEQSTFHAAPKVGVITVETAPHADTEDSSTVIFGDSELKQFKTKIYSSNASTTSRAEMNA